MTRSKMDSPITKSTTLLFLVATFCLVSIALADHNAGHPVTAPVHPPADSPVRPPLPPPVDPPAQPLVPHRPQQMGKVAFNGKVFCQWCKYAGSNDLRGATGINGAVMKIQCKIKETVIEMTEMTFGDGSFYLEMVDANINDFNNCKAYLVSSPLANCNIPTNIHSGITGGELKQEEPPHFRRPYYALYTVKPFAFLPKCN